MFIGIIIWNNPFASGANYIFFISQDGSFNEAEFEEIFDVDEDLIDEESCFPFLNCGSYHLYNGYGKSFIIEKDSTKRSFYFLNP